MWMFVHKDMGNSEISSRTFFSTLALIHAGMMIGPVLLLSIAFYINASGGYMKNLEIDMLNWIISLLAMGGIASSRLIFRIKISKAKSIENFKSRLLAYQKALFIRWALLEGPALVAVIGYLISGEVLFFYIAVMLIVVHLFSRVTRKKLVADLQLSSIERLLIEDPKAMIS